MQVMVLHKHNHSQERPIIRGIQQILGHTTPVVSTFESPRERQ